MKKFVHFLIHLKDVKMEINVLFFIQQWKKNLVSFLMEQVVNMVKNASMLTLKKKCQQIKKKLLETTSQENKEYYNQLQQQQQSSSTTKEVEKNIKNQLGL